MRCLPLAATKSRHSNSAYGIDVAMCIFLCLIDRTPTEVQE